VDILVVEDEPLDAKLARTILAHEGYTISEVTAAEQAAAVIERKKPQLILLDLHLPGMDGLTFVHQLKQDPQTWNIIIIAVTAYSDHWRRKEAINAGCHAYFIKPFETRELCRHIADILAQNPE
jgi:CheY-like chemotaxis protein